MVKKRADVYMVEKGLAHSREQAQRLIKENKVFADGKPVSKPSSMIDESSHLIVIEEESYVSRGGLKLEKALHFFNVNPHKMFAIDVGASTGGFTDCLLKHGARKVVAIDVGYGQLAWSLRTDPRVKVLERTNIKNVKPSDIDELADLITIDVSFISLEKILCYIVPLLKDNGKVISLVKPQFEAGREKVGKKGVVRDPNVHKDVLKKVWRAFEENELSVQGLTYSPIKGPEGNIEFLLYAVKFSEIRGIESKGIEEVKVETKKEIKKEEAREKALGIKELVMESQIIEHEKKIDKIVNDVVKEAHSVLTSNS